MPIWSNCTERLAKITSKWRLPKIACDAKWPQNIKSEIKQLLLIASSSKLKLQAMGQSQSVQKPKKKMTSNERQHTMGCPKNM